MSRSSVRSWLAPAALSAAALAGAQLPSVAHATPATAAFATAALAPAPTPEALAQLVDGRIPGLSSIGEIAVRPDGARYAFVAWVRYPGILADDAEIWIVDADGTGLLRIAASYPGSSSYASGVDSPRWWSDGTGLTYISRQSAGQPRSRPVSIDLSSGVPTIVPNFTELAGGRFRGAPYEDPTRGLNTGFWVKEVASGIRIEAVKISYTVDGVRTVSWTDACRGAALAGADPDGGLPGIEAQLTAATPGCRFDGWPVAQPTGDDVPDGNQPGGTQPGEVKTGTDQSPGEPKDSSAGSGAPASPSPTATPSPSAAPQTPSAPLTAPVDVPSPLATVISLRAVRSGSMVTGLRVKVGAAKGTRLKLWLIDASGAKTLARGSATAKGSSVVVDLPIGRSAAKAARTAGAGLTLRVSATSAAGKASTVTRAVAPLR